MNILVVSQYFWPESFLINDVVQGLHEKGHKVTVLTGMPNYPHGRFFVGYGPRGPFNENRNGVRILRVPQIPRGRGGGTRLGLNYLSFAAVASVLGPLFCRGSYDLILVYQPSPVTVGLPAIVLKKLKGLPIVFWVQDLWPESLSATGAVTSPRVLSLVSRLVRYIYGECDRILVQSHGFVPRVEKQGAKREDIRYLPNSADDFYRPMELESDAPEREEMPSGFRVMYAGNVGAAQSFKTILAAAGKLKGYQGIQWVVLGDGRMRSWVEERVERLGLKDTVHILGSRPAEMMPRYFALADALLVTLRKEPIFALTVPGKLQPYLACGRPVVAALDGEGARIVREAGAGLAVPAEDAEALAESVLELYRMSPEERERMGERGRAYFEEHFEREKLLDQLESWMHELTGEEKP